jgi:hypothetical protein
MSAPSLAAAQHQFTAYLPVVENATLYALRRRRLRRHDYEDILAEAIAACWSAWVGLISRGRDPLEVGVCGIANRAALYARSGRRIANRTCGRGKMDIFHRRAQKARGFRVFNSGGVEETIAEADHGVWTNCCTPADAACFKLDFECWLAGLPEKKRRVAELLAEGHEGVVVARLVGIAQSRVCQLRGELAANWQAFQEPASLPEAGDPRTARV